ncbi:MULTISPECIES: preprotein translocase subunit Sec61beta [Sulfurisphaera]|uniref:Preprotein translocase subunit SecG n=4 Tax=Sulfurisphaera TaxID=69655 RepID=SECG_SULTO|nr:MULTISPECIES: preprotein translocase subunit Sec61beta [Sulfurisphaera]Q975W7.1 RecName: Full=Preprotein translocase subunit SecG; AltName: Full=Protein transport protein Sec61 subunit beta homolog [Sulfurisphaera tokodaii str. 7]MBB5253147.1 preprotein translocase subunit Sec61beta [Sulfurisphaera ohwakuensis]QGR15939.1 preprotein translocase subunit Sec61beta [Sulfurisphaera ohwakuensis]BAB65281.1 preprotein translocase SecG subunit [Sulfurisphaera tokodaii str. 7]HII75019.1 preprotein tr
MPSSKKKKETVPLASMAGLIRYYEEENEKIKISPKLLIIISIIMVAGVIVASILIPPP